MKMNESYPDANFCIKSDDYNLEVFSKIFILNKPQRSNLSRITSRLYRETDGHVVTFSFVFIQFFIT